MTSDFSQELTASMELPALLAQQGTFVQLSHRSLARIGRTAPGDRRAAELALQV